MTQDNNILIVPWDYSKVSRYALDHALRLAQHIESSIQLLHIVSGQINSEEIKKKEDELQKIATSIKSAENIDIHFRIIAGSIFSTIAEHAEQENANLVIMGTHGIRGMQKLMGSWAYKVLLGSKVPFIIVKDKPKSDSRYANIVLPIDFKLENMEKMESAIFFGRYFNCKIHIFTAPSNKKHHEKLINININMATTLLTKSKIPFEIQSGKKASRFAKESIRFAEKIKADLILIMTTEHRLKDFIMGEHEQNIIDNSAKIPVLCVNPSPEYRDKNF